MPPQWPRDRSAAWQAACSKRTEGWYYGNTRTFTQVRGLSGAVHFEGQRPDELPVCLNEVYARRQPGMPREEDLVPAVPKGSPSYDGDVDAVKEALDTDSDDDDSGTVDM